MEFCLKASAPDVCLIQKHRMQDAYVIVLLHYQSAAYPSHPIVALVVIGQIEGIFCHGGSGSRGHPEPLNSWTPWTKIPGAVPAVSSAFSVGLRVTITVNSAATYTLIYDNWGERCVVADAAHPLLTADNQTVGVILEGRSLLSQPYACPYIVCCRSLSVFDLHTSSIGVGRSSFALLSQPLID